MDGLHLKRFRDSSASKAADTTAYIREAKEGLRRLTPATAVRPEIEHLQAKISEGVIDRVVDRILQDWEKGGLSPTSLHEQVMERLVDRLVAQFRATR